MWLLLLLIGLRECGLCLQGKLLWLFIERNIYLPSKGVASVLIFLEFFVLIIKQVRHHFANKGPNSYGFSSSHVQMWELDHKEGWVLKKLWCVESSLYCKIKPVNPKGNQSWIFIGRTNTEAEAPILWPPDSKSRCWERWKAEEGDHRGWDGWMASLTQRT